MKRRFFLASLFAAPVAVPVVAKAVAAVPAVAKVAAPNVKALLDCSVHNGSGYETFILGLKKPLSVIFFTTTIPGCHPGQNLRFNGAPFIVTAVFPSAAGMKYRVEAQAAQRGPWPGGDPFAAISDADREFVASRPLPRLDFVNHNR